MNYQALMAMLNASCNAVGEYGQPVMTMDDAGIASGQAFLTGELELRHPELLTPLTDVTWARDIDADYGGGFATDFTSHHFVDYGVSGANEYGIIGGATSSISIVQANITKDIWPVQTWGNVIRVKFLDVQRAMQTGRSIEDIHFDALNLNWNKSLDANVYTGYAAYGQTGLINDPNVDSSLVPVVGGQRYWANKDADTILTEFNRGLVQAWINSQYTGNVIPNHCLLPPLVFADLQIRKVSDAGNLSILEYIKANNIATSMGRSLQILPSRWVNNAGLPGVSGQTASGRAVFYSREKRYVSFDVPVSATRVMTNPVANQGAYESLYLGKIGMVKIKYPTTLYYLDGISAPTPV